MKLAALLLPAVALLYLFLPKQVETDDKTYSYSLKSTEQIRTELKSRSFKRASEREPRPTHIVYKNLRRDSNDGQNHRAPLAVKSYKQKLVDSQDRSMDAINDWLQEDHRYVSSADIDCKASECIYLIEYVPETTEEELAEFYYKFWSLEGKNPNIKRLEIVHNKENRTYGFKQIFYDSVYEREESKKGEKFDLAEDIVELSGALNLLTGSSSAAESFIDYSKRLVQTGLDAQYFMNLNSFDSDCTSEGSCKLKMHFSNNRTYDERELDLLSTVFDIVAQQPSSRISEHMSSCEYNECEITVKLN